MTTSAGPTAGQAERPDPGTLQQLVELTGRERGRYAELRLTDTSVAEALATIARERAQGKLDERRISGDRAVVSLVLDKLADLD
jgi:hypothetical protein